MAEPLQREDDLDPPGPAPTQLEDAPMSPGSAAQPLQIGALGESPMEEDRSCPSSASPKQSQPDDVPMSLGGAAQPLPVGTGESRTEEDRPCPSSASPNQPQLGDVPMSPEGAVQLLQLGAPENHPEEPPSLSPASILTHFLSRSDEMTGEPYPSAMEGAEESGPGKEPTRPAGPSGGRLPSTGHIPHVPGP